MIINFGSINIDHVYRVAFLPQPGETLSARTYEKFLGGKGVNQSVAIAQAGGDVRHVGAIGEDGDWALRQIESLGVSAEAVAKLTGATGHAIIFVSDDAENEIVIEGGANQRLSEDLIDNVLKSENPGSDWILLQNETNLGNFIADQAKKLGFKIAYSAAPFAAQRALELLPKIDLLAVNEIEAAALAAELGVKEDEIPVHQVLITKAADGARLKVGNEVYQQKAFKVEAVDTTGAGDTFLGSFLARYTMGIDAATALAYATAASAIQVTRPGAATAIPTFQDVTNFMAATS